MNTQTSTSPVPLEREEQMVVVDFLELQGLKFSAIPLSTFTASWSVKRRNWQEGVRAGVPDLLILIPPHKAKDGIGRCLFVEMKRRRGGTVSAEQREWIAALNGLGSPSVESVVAHGADEAIEYLSGYLKVVEHSPF